VTRTRCRMLIRYHSNVGSSAQGRGLRHLRILSTPGGVLMEQGRDHGPPLQNVYDTASALPGTNPAPSTSARSGRRTGKMTINRIAKEDVLGGEPCLLHIRLHRGAQVPLPVEVPGVGTDRGRCTVFQPRRMFEISTSRCRCPKPSPRGTPRKACVVGGNRVPVRKPRLVPDPRTIYFHTFL